MWKDTNSSLTLSKATKIIEKSNCLNLDGNMKYTSLPEGLIIPGNLVISHTSIVSIPKNTTVMGNLYASHSSLSYIHPSVRIHGNIYLDNTKIKEIPENIGESAKDGNILDISNTAVSIFPYSWRGKVYAKYTKIKELKGNVFFWYVDVSGTQIKELPEAFFYDVLNISDTAITQIPEKLFVPTLIYYNCNISDGDIPKAIINRIH